MKELRKENGETPSKPVAASESKTPKLKTPKMKGESLDEYLEKKEKRKKFLLTPASVPRVATAKVTKTKAKGSDGKNMKEKSTRKLAFEQVKQTVKVDTPVKPISVRKTPRKNKITQLENVTEEEEHNSMEGISQLEKTPIKATLKTPVKTPAKAKTPVKPRAKTPVKAQAKVIPKTPVKTPAKADAKTPVKPSSKTPSKRAKTPAKPTTSDLGTGQADQLPRTQTKADPFKFSGLPTSTPKFKFGSGPIKPFGENDENLAPKVTLTNEAKVKNGEIEMKGNYKNARERRLAYAKAVADKNKKRIGVKGITKQRKRQPTGKNKFENHRNLHN